MLSERVKDWTKNWKQQGIEEGRREGLQEGKMDLLLRQLEWRFGAVSEAISTRVKQADSPTLELWSKRILTAQTIEEVFAD